MQRLPQAIAPPFPSSVNPHSLQPGIPSADNVERIRRDQDHALRVPPPAQFSKEILVRFRIGLVSLRVLDAHVRRPRQGLQVGDGRVEHFRRAVGEDHSFGRGGRERGECGVDVWEWQELGVGVYDQICGGGWDGDGVFQQCVVQGLFSHVVVVFEEAWNFSCVSGKGGERERERKREGMVLPMLLRRNMYSNW